MITILIVILVLVIAYRGYRVSMYRHEFVIRVAQKAVKAEDTVDLIKGAFEELDRVPYQEMIYKFWIPVDKFLDEDNIFNKDAK